VRRWMFGTCFVLACGSGHAADEGERRWRVFEQSDGAILAISHTDDATDDLGSPFFRCRSGSGTLQVEGTAKEDLRSAVADLIRANEYPELALFPIESGASALLNLSYSEMDSEWQYSFDMEAVGPTFDDFKRTGQLAFKLGTTVVREEFKTGSESAARFQEICRRPSK
jgi:hypothetical protein